MPPSTPEQSKVDDLSPRWVRLIVFIVLIIIAIGAIWLIDTRAMQRQAELEAEKKATPTLKSQWIDMRV